MKADCVETLLPENTLIHREYEAQIDDVRTTVTITLAQMWDGTEKDSADKEDVELCGYILVVHLAGASFPPMVWTFKGGEISIVAANLPAGTLPSELRMAIGAFVLHFIGAIDEEIKALGGPSPTVH